MRASKFMSTYLRKEEIDGDQELTISSVEVEEVGPEKDPKPVMYFKEIEKGMIIGSKAVLNTLIDAFGDETDEWVGKKITVYVDPNVAFKGKRIGGLRVKA